MRTQEFNGSLYNVPVAFIIASFIRYLLLFFAPRRPLIVVAIFCLFFFLPFFSFFPQLFPSLLFLLYNLLFYLLHRHFSISSFFSLLVTFCYPFFLRLLFLILVNLFFLPISFPSFFSFFCLAFLSTLQLFNYFFTPLPFSTTTFPYRSIYERKGFFTATFKKKKTIFINESKFDIRPMSGTRDFHKE